MKKNPVHLLALMCFLPALGACGREESSESEAKKGASETSAFDGTSYYEAIGERVSYQTDSTLSFEESFSSGKMNDDLWYVIDGYWDAGGESNWHNGLRNDNVFYIDDGGSTYLGIRARGMYCQDEDLAKTSAGRIKPEGAGFISKDFLAPGRYEITMRAMPREGGVTAMWTYFCATGSEETSQNEIDIELGGDGQYTNEWCTSWTTHTTKETDSVDCSSVCYFNDGKFHTYTFDWYTDYCGSDTQWVDWFVDGVLVKQIHGDCVPFTQMPLWIGVWLPSWAGNPYFDTDYMIIKNVSYKQFDETSQWYASARGNCAYSPKTPSSLTIKTLEYEDVSSPNKLANPSFETDSLAVCDSSYYGWKEESASKGSLSFVSDANEGQKAIKLTAGESKGEYLDQNVSLLYPGYEIDLSIDAKLADENSEGNIEIWYCNSAGGEIDSVLIPVTGTSWATYTKKVTLPAKTGIVKLALTAEKGSVLYDNASLTY